MVKLVDTSGLSSDARMGVWVRVPLRLPLKKILLMEKLVLTFTYYVEDYYRQDAVIAFEYSSKESAWGHINRQVQDYIRDYRKKNFEQDYMELAGNRIYTKNLVHLDDEVPEMTWKLYTLNEWFQWQKKNNRG